MVEYEYAKAIFELAVEEKKTELFLDYFNGLLDVLSTSKDFYKFLASPLVDTKEKIRGNIYSQAEEENHHIHVNLDISS